MKDSNDEEKLKDEMVRQVQIMAAMFNAYTMHLGLDAYECTLEFMFTEGEGRIRLTDAKFKKDDATGKLKKIPNESTGPHASSLDDAEARRQSGDKEPEGPPEPKQTPEQVVAALMGRLKLK